MKCGNLDVINTWKKLQTSDHFYYMCTKYWKDGDVHKYFSPYDSPYDAYIYNMNVFSDFECRLNKILESQRLNQQKIYTQKNKKKQSLVYSKN